MLSKTLNATSALAISIVLLGTTFIPASQAMMVKESVDDIPFKGIHQVAQLKSYADLAHNPTDNIPSIRPGDLLLINVGHGLVHSSQWVTEDKTETHLFEQHTNFMNMIKEANEQDYENLTKKIKLASGNEFIKVGEKDLPTLLDDFSNSGINIIATSRRCDDGTSATNETPEILSRTEAEFVKLGYNYKSWKKPSALQTIVELNNPNAPEDHGTYRLRNGTIYSTSGKRPHKSVAIVSLVNILKETNQLPSAIYFTDGEKTINQTADDLKDINFGIPLYLLKYTQPKAFRTPEDLKEFCMHRLGEKFQDYETQFNHVFLGK